MNLFFVRLFQYLCGEPLIHFLYVIFLTAKCFQTRLCLAYGIFGRSTYSSLNHLLILTCQKFYIFPSSFRIIKYVFFLFFSRFSDFSLQCHNVATTWRGKFTDICLRPPSSSIHLKSSRRQHSTSRSPLNNIPSVSFKILRQSPAMNTNHVFSTDSSRRQLRDV